ncbi:MAG TPA: enoyl-CoA hydratase-related protein [Candidatus Binataceae bacterium]|nr:enoyl-CoA hydratase-related protein [Candidatus Binataceae bacterium]
MDYNYDFLDINVTDRVATVTIKRPEYFSYEVHHEVEEIWTDLAADHEVNAIILTGAGNVFLNPREMGMARAPKPSRRNHGRHQTSNGRRIVQNFLDVEQPIIGAINGDAFSLGATLALMCDVTVASETARIADTHVKMGVVAGDGGAVIWPLLIGPHRAKEYLMRGNIINGADAARIGLVNYAVPADQVLLKAKELARELADGPTWAIRWSKLAVNKWLKRQSNLIMDAGLAYEAMTLKAGDHQEALRAASERRKPDFVSAKK